MHNVLAYALFSALARAIFLPTSSSNSSLGEHTAWPMAFSFLPSKSARLNTDISDPVYGCTWADGFCHCFDGSTPVLSSSDGMDILYCSTHVTMRFSLLTE